MVLLSGGLREIHDQTGLTTVVVTHDQDEAMELADLVVVMSMGRIAQVGTPQRHERMPLERVELQVDLEVRHTAGEPLRKALILGDPDAGNFPTSPT